MSLMLVFNLLMLSSLIAGAVVYDIRCRRIPNRLVLTGIVIGLFVRTFWDFNGESVSMSQSLAVVVSAAMGGLSGLFLFLPFYALRTMGAGDVKLLAMVGVWVGSQTVFWAAVFTLAAGGVLALAFALYSGVLRQVLQNVQAMVMSTTARMQGAPALPRSTIQTTGRLPYAVAIACGTSLALVHRAGWLPL